MKINEIMDLNPVRKLFLEYFEDIKKAVEENINEDLIKKVVYDHWKMDIIKSISVSTSSPAYNNQIIHCMCLCYENGIEIGLPENTFLELSQKYVEQFEKIGFDELPYITFWLFTGEVSIEYIGEHLNANDFFKRFFDDMEIDDFTMIDTSKKLFRF